MCVALAICGGCSVAPISLSGLDKNAYLTDEARIDKLVDGERACVMAQAALCAYDVEQHTTTDGKLDQRFCLGLSGFAPVEAYGTPKPYAPQTKSAWVTAGLRGPVVRVQVPDYGAKPSDAAFVARRGEDIIIAFRGTAPSFYEFAFSADWANNVEADLVPDKDLSDVDIHKGFRESLASTFSDVVKYLNALLAERGKSIKGIYLTGHSKGGALAYIAALKLKRLDPRLPIKGVYTFAAPRPGGEKFSKTYESALAAVPTWRFENRGDFVPHLVPQEAEADSLREYLALVGRHKFPIGRYQSVGTLVFINADQGLVLQMDPRASKLAELRARSISIGGTLSAHRMESYLETACKRAPFAR
jgi:hypothetical protein